MSEYLYTQGLFTAPYNNSAGYTGDDLQYAELIYYCENIGSGIFKNGLALVFDFLYQFLKIADEVYISFQTNPDL